MTRNNGNNGEASKQEKYIDDPDLLRNLVQTFLQEYLPVRLQPDIGLEGMPGGEALPLRTNNIL